MLIVALGLGLTHVHQIELPIPVNASGNHLVSREPMPQRFVQPVDCLLVQAIVNAPFSDFLPCSFAVR